MEGEKICKRNGCRKKYQESDNSEGVCKYHPGKPIFHDCKKGWTCCNITVYDWDEFEKIEGCATEKHSDIKVKPKDGQEFFKSSTVSNAEKSISNGAMQPTKTIDEFNKEQEVREAELKKEEQKIEMVVYLTKTGAFKCSNLGCLKAFTEDQVDDECSYHPGPPIFHDCKKGWACCNKVVYDFDAFLKIEPCMKGKHVKKMVKAK